MKHETPQPLNVDDSYHILELSSVLLVQYWLNFLQITSGLEGDFVEFGIGRSKSLLIIRSLQLISLKNPSSSDSFLRDIWAFDSFEGFPEPVQDDLTSTIRTPIAGEWSTSPHNGYKYDINFSKSILRNASLDCNNIHYVPGFFQKTANQYPKNRRIAILHLDGDLYESYKLPLLNLYDQIVPGGLIVIDDFYYPALSGIEDKFPGARKAVYEFLDLHPELFLQTSLRGTPFIQKPV